MAMLLLDRIVDLVVELCVDGDSMKFEECHWKIFKKRVDIAAKVRNSRSLIEG